MDECIFCGHEIVGYPAYRWVSNIMDLPNGYFHNSCQDYWEKTGMIQLVLFNPGDFNG